MMQADLFHCPTQLQAATNTSLDLDVRPLPKFITLPRRRRRRVVVRPGDPSAPAVSTASAGAATTAGQGTSSVSTRPGTEVTARSDAMNNMLAEDQDNYLARSTGMVS